MFVNIEIHEYLGHRTKNIILKEIWNSVRLENKNIVTYGLHFPLLSPYEVSQQALTWRLSYRVHALRVLSVIRPLLTFPDPSRVIFHGSCQCTRFYSAENLMKRPYTRQWPALNIQYGDTSANNALRVVNGFYWSMWHLFELTPTSLLMELFVPIAVVECGNSYWFSEGGILSDLLRSYVCTRDS